MVERVLDLELSKDHLQGRALGSEARTSALLDVVLPMLHIPRELSYSPCSQLKSLFPLFESIVTGLR